MPAFGVPKNRIQAIAYRQEAHCGHPPFAGSPRFPTLEQCRLARYHGCFHCETHALNRLPVQETKAVSITRQRDVFANTGEHLFTPDDHDQCCDLVVNFADDELMTRLYVNWIASSHVTCAVCAVGTARRKLSAMYASQPREK